MLNTIKKVIISASLVGSSTVCAYSAFKMMRSMRSFNKEIKSINRDELRKEVRHFSEMVEMMRYGITE